MEVIPWDEHLEALATRRNGETTSAPAFGLVMVTVAKAGTAQTRRARRSKVKFFMHFSKLRIDVSGDAHSAYKITLAGAAWRHQHTRGCQNFAAIDLLDPRSQDDGESL